MAASSISHRWKYDVFVSFRGEDIRKGFVDHLFKDFMQKGIHAFRDDNQLPKGEEISPQLYKAIEESRFLIVIFSQTYASSSWCLRELVKILACKQSGKPKHEVQIIFYDVKPDVVRKQTNSYAKAFLKHENLNPTEVAGWKKALSSAADLCGWDLQDTKNGYESKFIDSITKEVVPELPPHTIRLSGDCTSLRGLLERLNSGHIFFSCIFMGFPKSFKNLTIHESQGSMSQPLLLDAAPNSNGSRNQFFSLLRYLALCFPCIFTGCPKSYENLTIHESQGSMSQPLLLDASPNSNGSRNQFFSLLQYLALQINKCGIFPAQGDHAFPESLHITYYGNRIPQWFTNHSKGNRVKVDLPSDWCYDRFSGYGFCVVFTPKNYYSSRDQYSNNLKFSVNNFDGTLLDQYYIGMGESIRNCGSDMIWLSYSGCKRNLYKAEKFVTFSFEAEVVEVKKLGVRFVYKEDIEKGFESSMIQDIPTPTQLGGTFYVETHDGIGTRLRW